jgi:GNAT superfamily N-acetyltransferase
MLSHPTVGELRVTAYRALGLLSAGSGYAEPLRALGFGGDGEVLVAADEAGNGILGTVTLEAFAPASELAKDDTEADIRAFAVAPSAQGHGVGRKLPAAVIERAEQRGVWRLLQDPGPRLLPGLEVTLRASELALPHTEQIGLP